MFKETENHSFGFICLFRSIRKNWIWDDEKKLKWWLDIIMEVNHQDAKVVIGNQLLECKRGESLKSLHTWAMRWRANVASVRRFLILLEKDGMIHYKSEGKTTRITVCNYDSYNGERNEDETQTARKRNDGGTQTATNNNANNVNQLSIALSDEEKNSFEAFQTWLSCTAPSVAKMKEPFTIAQYLKLKQKISDEKIKSLVEDMENWEGLKKRTSALKTFNTFNKRNSTTVIPFQSNQSTAPKKMVI